MVTVAALCLLIGYYIGTLAPAGAYTISAQPDSRSYETVPPVQETSAVLQETGAPEETIPAMININTADAAALMTLPGIGEVKANAIVAYREANGPFVYIEELLLVDGIGEGLLEKIRDSITIGE